MDFMQICQKIDFLKSVDKKGKYHDSRNLNLMIRIINCIAIQISQFKLSFSGQKEC